MEQATPSEQRPIRVALVELSQNTDATSTPFPNCKMKIVGIVMPDPHSKFV